MSAWAMLSFRFRCRACFLLHGMVFVRELHACAAINLSKFYGPFITQWIVAFTHSPTGALVVLL